jgi:hypothetical protein
MFQLAKAKVGDILPFEVGIRQGLIWNAHRKFSLLCKVVNHPEGIGVGIRFEHIAEILDSHERKPFCALGRLRKEGPPRRRDERAQQGPPLGLDLHNVSGLKALWALAYRELHCLALTERPVAGVLNGAVVDENVAPGAALDEAETLGIVEPLDCTLFFHCILFPLTQ